MKRRAIFSIAGALSALVFAGCDLWNSMFGVTDEEAKEAVSLVLNAFVDTYPAATNENLAYNGTGLVRYTSTDGSFACEYSTAGGIRQTFKDYRPNFSDYRITGENFPPPEPFGPDTVFNFTYDSSLTFSGGEITSVRLNLTAYGVTKDYRVSEIRSVFGSANVNGRQFGDISSWNLQDLFERNINVLLTLVKTATTE